MPKLLADFLLEQQEPFALQVYLVERGYPKRLTSKFVAPNCSYFVRAVFSQLVASGGRRNFITGKSPENAAEDGASTSCWESESAIRRLVKCGNCFLEGEPTQADEADRNSKLRGEEEERKQQLRPVSVLGLDYSNVSTEQCNFKRRVKQLLIDDCTQELIGKHRKRDINRDEMNEEIWRHVWTQNSITQTQSNILHPLHSDLLAWNAVLEQHKFEIFMEIQNVILENVIDEIITCQLT